MKKVIVIIVTIISVASIIAGKVHWDNKIKATANFEVETKIKNIENVKVDNKAQKSEIMKYTANLPEEINHKISNAIDSGKPVKLVLMGSESTPKDPQGWPSLLKEELLNTYGKDIFNVAISEIPEQTSTMVLQNDLYHEALQEKPDILLLEPFILYDNGKVRFEERINNLESMLEEFYRTLPDLTVILQPANPLYNARFYPNEVRELQRYAEENGFLYLNHWEAWPDYQSEEIQGFLTEEGGLPNEKGHKVWAEYVRDYFISTIN